MIALRTWSSGNENVKSLIFHPKKSAFLKIDQGCMV